VSDTIQMSNDGMRAAIVVTIKDRINGMFCSTVKQGSSIMKSLRS